MNRRNKDTSAGVFWRRGFVALIFLFLLAFAGGGYAFFVAGEKKSVSDVDGEPPVVKAEVIKTTPKVPGGMEIPHQDKRVFGRLTAEDANDDGGVVMGAGAEEPLLYLASETVGLDVPLTGAGKSAPSRQGGYVAQLASFAERVEAEAGKEKLQARFPDLLASSNVVIQSTDLGKRGIWHRLHVGYFETRSLALDVCRMFKERGLDCLVTVR